MSSFGGPGGGQPAQKPIPPQRGSFPLDHDGECKDIMTKYLSCIRKVKGLNNDQCRGLAKDYLTCRMDKNLMAKDEFKNLGFVEPATSSASTTTTTGTTDNEVDKGLKGELRW
ncbi:Cytochrome c oxidase assembly protein COX19 [Zalerion maritima]|uniref:Cytochrome c oxidase assembly protein COX19 n=1 Tax=Zalerion maritima TaxID=339359 RepID=A0AAD5RVI2_9PEZI|nr:Cytochrome c oxidase assembly protein COX19 [Zalerion maritima]